MCHCATYQPLPAAKLEDSATDALTVKVEDMTCGHCAGTIVKAITAGLPGVRVQADPMTKLVSVQGAPDLTMIQSLIAGAGYTPSIAPG